MGGDGGRAGAALDTAGGDDQGAVAAGGAGSGGGGDPGELARQVGGAVGPGEQAAGAGGHGRPDVGRAVVVADGDQRGPAVGWKVGQDGAPDQGDRRVGGEGGGQAGDAGGGHQHLPAGRGLDGVPQGVGRGRVVVATTTRGGIDGTGSRATGILPVPATVG